MGVFFMLAHPVLMDDGLQYQGFTEKLGHGVVDFRSFYGFQGISFFAVPIYWLTHSHNSIIIVSMIFSLLSIPLIYAVGKRMYPEYQHAGWLAIVLFLLTPYPYVTIMRGFQEAALLFFILLILYGSFTKRRWTPLAWGIGGIVKPFSLVLFPLFWKDAIQKKAIPFLVAGIAVGVAYITANYIQTGHFVTLAATGAYQGQFDPAHIPALGKSFAGGVWGFLRVGANLLLAHRKIMVSPVLVILGFIALWRRKNLIKRKAIFLAVLLNILLVGPITFAFPKYLLPMTTLLSLAAIPILIKYPWTFWLVLVDSISVFIPVYGHFGVGPWPNPFIFFIPFFIALALIIWQHLSWSRHFGSETILRN